jgi:hypothetical protein
VGFIDKKGVEVIKAQFDEFGILEKTLPGYVKGIEWGFIKIH